MNNQEIFEYVVTFLAAQGEQSVDRSKMTHLGGRCLYRGPRGTKCALGCLISDDEYDTSFEGRFVIRLMGRINILSFDNFDMFISLVQAHDSRDTWDSEETFKKAFIKCGEEHMLDTSFIDSLSVDIKEN